MRMDTPSRKIENILFGLKSLFVIAFIVLMPLQSYKVVMHPISLSASDIFLFCSFSMYTFLILFRGRVIIIKEITRDLFFLSGLLISATAAVYLNGGHNILYVFYLFTSLFFIYFVISTTPISMEVKILIQSLIISACVAAILASTQSFFDVFPNMGRPAPARELGPITIPVTRSAGPYGTYGNFGMLLLAILPTLLLCQLKFKEQSILLTRFTLNSATFIVLSGIFVSQTRGTWLAAMIVTILTFIVYSWREGTLRHLIKSLKPVLISLVPISSILFILLIRMNVGTIMIRIETYIIAIRVFLQNPIYGVGYQNFISSGSEYGAETAIHNIFLEVLVTTGLIGTLFFSLFLIQIILRARELLIKPMGDDILSVSLPIGAIGVMIQAQVVQGLYSQEFWMMMGIITAIYMKESKYSEL